MTIILEDFSSLNVSEILKQERKYILTYVIVGFWLHSLHSHKAA